MTNTKIERLKAIKEEFAIAQSRLSKARQLEESAQPGNMATLLENDLEQAELVLAAQDMMHKLQNMAEDLAKMNAQDLFPLVDKMKAAFGQEAAHSFEESSQEAITGAMNTVRRAKDEMGNSIMRLEGKVPPNDMSAGAGMDSGASMGDNAPAPDAGAVDAAMDDFGGADAASGPEQEPLGRARKESREGGRALTESMILEATGKRLIEAEGLDSLIEWVLKEAAAGMPEEHFRSFATSVAKKAANNPNKLAGWIGTRKYGKAVNAQLDQPTNTQAVAQKKPELELAEGKTFKNSDDEDDNWKKKSSDKARSNARREKGKGEDLEEGKTFKNSDDEDDNWKKKSSDKSRSNARREKQKGDDLEEGKTFKNNDDEDNNWDKKNATKSRSAARREKNKGDEKVTETTLAAKALAQIIEANVKKNGKGMAAKAVKETIAYLDKNVGLNESEGGNEAALLEAFQEAYGMKPAAYSVRLVAEAAPLSTQDKKYGASAMAKVAGKMGTNPSAAKQSVQAAMTGMDGQERNAANKMLNTMKASGTPPKNAGEFAQAASGMIDDDDKDAVQENINAAHWPLDSQGQYKGEPMSTDYGKLKPMTGAPKAGKTEGGAPETKVEEPKVDGAKAPEGGKPWEKKSKTPEPKAEEPAEDNDSSDDEK